MICAITINLRSRVFRGVLFFLLGCALPSLFAGSASLIPSPEKGWPQFRGPRRDGVSDEKGLLAQWPEKGPRLLWSAEELGNGFSSPVISRGRVVITGDIREKLILTAFDLQGNRLWRAGNGASWKTPYPGARASATLYENRVYHQNAHGRVACLEAENGREAWFTDILSRFGGANVTWGLSECLLVDEKAVYVTAGGKEALVVALNRRTGSLIWKSPPLFDSTKERTLESAGYASPILVEFDKRRLLIGVSLNYLYCLDAETGRMQWTQSMHTAYSVLAMMPALAGDGIFMTAPHGQGGRLWRLKPGKTIGVEEVWRTELDTCQGGVVFHAGRIFGSFYPGRKGWAAVDAGTGSLLYQSTEWTKGAPLFADGRLYTLLENGWMLLMEPLADSFVLRGKFRLAEARPQDAWAHPVILDGRLYLRYHDILRCYDLHR